MPRERTTNTSAPSGEANIKRGSIMTEWRPIDDDARSGEDILAYSTLQHFCEVVAWNCESGTKYPWITQNGPDYPSDLFSHWMPIPALPTRADDHPDCAHCHHSYMQHAKGPVAAMYCRHCPCPCYELPTGAPHAD